MFIKNFDVLARDYLHRVALQLIEYGLAIADPYNAVKSSLKVFGDRIFIRDVDVEVKVSGKVHVVGFGKASKRMAEAIYSVFAERVAGGVVIALSDEGYVGNVRIVRGDHPIPGENSLKASQLLLDYLKNYVSEEDLVIVLISGGGSALFEIPREGVSLSDIAWISRELMKRGADIFELNAVRKRFSGVKGGKLLRFIRSKRVISLIVSDVVGDRLDTIASGPTAPDESTAADAYNVLVKYGLWNELKEPLKRIIERGIAGFDDALKYGDTIFTKVVNVIVASNKTALESMASRAREMGFNALILTTMLEGEAREVGKVLASIIKSIDAYSHPIPKPAVLLAGGETVVTVRGSGIGGRNQELCLSLAISIKGMDNTIAICIGSDGIDGISPAAGAIISGSTYYEALAKGLNPLDYLNNNDSYTFFSKINRAIITGDTGTNINDILIAIVI
jgi:glycerate 2-kinase